MAALQKMVQAMKATMEAMGVGAQNEGPREGSKGHPSEALVIPEEGPELPEDGPEAPAEGPTGKGPCGGDDIARNQDKGKAKVGKTVEPEAQRAGQGPKRPAERAPSQACSGARRHRQAYNAPDAPTRQTRGREMESVSLPGRPEKRTIREASVEVESTEIEE